MKYIISYDISSDKNRKKISELLAETGIRVQYSVFQCELKKTKLVQLKIQLSHLLERKTDSILFIPVCGKCEQGSDALGVLYTALPLSIVSVDND